MQIFKESKLLPLYVDLSRKTRLEYQRDKRYVLFTKYALKAETLSSGIVCSGKVSGKRNEKRVWDHV